MFMDVPSLVSSPLVTASPHLVWSQPPQLRLLLYGRSVLMALGGVTVTVTDVTVTDTVTVTVGLAPHAAV